MRKNKPTDTATSANAVESPSHEGAGLLIPAADCEPYRVALIHALGYLDDTDMPATQGAVLRQLYRMFTFGMLDGTDSQQQRRERME